MIDLKLTDEQAKIVSRACEFYARIILGQFSEILIELVNEDNIDNISKHKDEIKELLFTARNLIYPELQGQGHSYGVGKFSRADTAYDVHQAIRQLFGDPRPGFSYNELPNAVKYIDDKEVK